MKQSYEKNIAEQDRKIPSLNLMIGKEVNTTNAVVGTLRSSDNKKDKVVHTTRKNSTLNIYTINTILDL